MKFNLNRRRYSFAKNNRTNPQAFGLVNNMIAQQKISRKKMPDVLDTLHNFDAVKFFHLNQSWRGKK
jgi:hypothetical protein